VVGVTAALSSYNSSLSTNAKLGHTTSEEFQTLLVTSLIMTNRNTQRARAEVKCIRFYTQQDLSLGQFLVESCFSLSNKGNAAVTSSSATSTATIATKDSMLGSTLTFAHRSGRVDITVNTQYALSIPALLGLTSNTATSSSSGTVSGMASTMEETMNKLPQLRGDPASTTHHNVLLFARNVVH